MTVLRVVTLGPALLVSFVLAVVVCALLPPALGLVLFLAAAGRAGRAGAGPARGAGDRGADQVAARDGGRVPGDGAGAGRAGWPWRRRRLAVRASSAAAAVRRWRWRSGRRAVVVTPGLVEATYRGGVTGAEAAAVLAHAVGRRRAIRPRLELAVLAATTPWRMVVATFRGVGRAFAWLPFMRVAWTLRGVVGVICVVQSVAEGRACAGAAGWARSSR